MSRRPVCLAGSGGAQAFEQGLYPAKWPLPLALTNSINYPNSDYLTKSVIEYIRTHYNLTSVVANGRDNRFGKSAMPKAFTQDERAAIRQKLMTEGLRRFTRHGVRALRIDDLCRDIGIAKGSFYAFFPSKEDLFFALADFRDAQHKREMMAEILAAKGSPAEVLGQFFDMVMQRLETDPLVQIVQDAGELAYVMRHAPPDYIAENTRRDREFVVALAHLFKERFGLGHADAAALEGVMTLMVSVSLQEDFLKSSGVYAPTVALLRDMSLKRLIEGPIHD